MKMQDEKGAAHLEALPFYDRTSPYACGAHVGHGLSGGVSAGVLKMIFRLRGAIKKSANSEI
ncbi:hypothetical protein [Paraburkholderia antibiotica]|nr:hypothetical protein [Paraburkholderia antibiotica]